MDIIDHQKVILLFPIITILNLNYFYIVWIKLFETILERKRKSSTRSLNEFNKKIRLEDEQSQVQNLFEADRIIQVNSRLISNNKHNVCFSFILVLRDK